MPNRNYQKGYELENLLVNNLLKKYNFLYASRTAGSHSIADVIGITPSGVTVFFQCKSTDNEIIHLTSIIQSGNVIKLREMPESIRKIIVIKEGYMHSSRIYVLQWNDINKKWNKINFKLERKLK